MMRPFLLAAIAASITTYTTAQERCTSHTITERWLVEHGQPPDLAHALAKTSKGLPKGGATPTIPVAVHVVWNTAAENVSDALIQNMITTMNQDYQAQNSDWNDVRATFAGDRANPNILFCLAQVDPNGAATTGITRTQTSQTWFDPDTETDDMKSAPDGIAPWDPHHYLNIWICDISSGATGGLVTLGYAYLPVGNMVGSSIDGFVVDYNYGMQAGARTATHEIGHYLGLEHPWADGGCGSDDGMNDTPVTDEPTFSCSNTSLMNCSELTMYENFMDYADCSMMFTNDQAAYMNSILNGARSGLLNTGACGTVIGGPCIPTSAGGTSENDFIDGVHLGSINNLNSGSNTGPSYTDYSGQFTTSLARDGDYTVTVTSGDYTPDNYAVWIDYNQNDAFEAGEKLGEWQNTAVGQSHDFSFTVPNSAALGNTVMRVRGVYFNTGEPTPVGPCDNYSYGETEDYGITITSNGTGPCIPTSVNGAGDGDYVDGVSLEDINNTGSGSTNGATYHDYTAQSTVLYRNSDYTINVTSGDYDQDILGAWIDFNANDVFEASELLGEGLTASTFETQAFNFSVPANATLGTTVLRVRCMFPDTDLGEPTNADPCVNFSWGETEDYSVVIGTNVGLDGTAASIPTVSPNPADRSLSFNMSEGQARHVEVFDLSGRMLISDAIRTGPGQVDVSSLANGRYVLRCIVDGRTSTIPFSVLHTR